MASGVIMGECPVCGELIWEDEWDEFNGQIIHEGCKRKAAIKAAKMSEGQYDKICDIRNVEREIKDLKQELAGTFEYYKKQIDDLESILEKNRK